MRLFCVFRTVCMRAYLYSSLPKNCAICKLKCVCFSLWSRNYNAFALLLYEGLISDLSWPFNKMQLSFGTCVTYGAALEWVNFEDKAPHALKCGKCPMLTITKHGCLFWRENCYRFNAVNFGSFVRKIGSPEAGVSSTMIFVIWCEQLLLDHRCCLCHLCLEIVPALQCWCCCNL